MEHLSTLFAPQKANLTWTGERITFDDNKECSKEEERVPFDSNQCLVAVMKVECDQKPNSACSGFGVQD
jgi:hypothetical protein